MEEARGRGPSHGWDRYPNLRWPGPSSWAKGRGRIQLAVKRAFTAAGTSTLTTSDVFDYALARHRQDQWRRRHRGSVVRVLSQVADRVGRLNAPGRPWIWRLR